MASLIYDKARDVNVLKGVKGKFYQADGSNITIESETGEIDMKTKTITLEGHPKGVFSTGGELNAEKLSWFSKDEKIVAEGNVKITKDDIVATAQKATMQRYGSSRVKQVMQVPPVNLDGLAAVVLVRRYLQKKTD